MPSTSLGAPHSAQGIAKNQTEAQFPSLWKELRLFLAPSAGLDCAQLAVDHSPYRLNCVPTNFANTDFEPGYKGLSYNGDNSNNWIQCPNRQHFGITADITIALWVTKEVNGSYRSMFAKTNAARWNYDFYFQTTNIMNFYSDSIGAVAATTAITDAAWRHLCVTRKADVVTFYINGKVDSSTSGKGTAFANNTDDIRIMQDDNASYWGGNMDDIGLWARALEPGEVLLLAQGFSPLTLRPKTLNSAKAPSATAYTLTAAQGSYSLTGQTANLLRGLDLIASQGSYSLTGQTANLLEGHKVIAAQGSYSLSGQTANLLRGLKLTAASGSYSLSGQTANLLEGYKITATQGAYSLSGQDAILNKGDTLTANSGSYTLTGQAAGLTVSRVVSADTGYYALTGQAATLTETESATVSEGWLIIEDAPKKKKKRRKKKVEAREPEDTTPLREDEEIQALVSAAATKAEKQRLSLELFWSIVADIRAAEEEIAFRLSEERALMLARAAIEAEIQRQDEEAERERERKKQQRYREDEDDFILAMLGGYL